MLNRPGLPKHFQKVADISTITKNKCKELKVYLREWKASGITEVDLVAGGPPCQGYSAIGIRRTHKAEKNTKIVEQL